MESEEKQAPFVLFIFSPSSQGMILTVIMFPRFTFLSFLEIQRLKFFLCKFPKVTCNGDVNEMAFNLRNLQPIGPWPVSGRGIGAVTARE